MSKLPDIDIILNDTLSDLEKLDVGEIPEEIQNDLGVYEAVRQTLIALSDLVREIDNTRRNRESLERHVRMVAELAIEHRDGSLVPVQDLVEEKPNE